MILMALFSLAMIVGMPYLLDNMDPESRAEFEQIQKQNPLANAANPAAALGNFDFASWMAGRGNEQDSDASAQSSATGKGQSGARRR
jgi:ER membrane protein complex subunit 7